MQAYRDPADSQIYLTPTREQSVRQSVLSDTRLFTNCPTTLCPAPIGDTEARVEVPTADHAYLTN